MFCNFSIILWQIGLVIRKCFGFRSRMISDAIIVYFYFNLMLNLDQACPTCERMRAALVKFLSKNLAAGRNSVVGSTGVSKLFSRRARLIM